MKLPTAVLVGSLAVNLVGAAIFVWRPEATRTFLRRAFGSVNTPPRQVTDVATSTARDATKPTLPKTDAPLATIDWANLQPSDFAGLPARLTALGFPPETARGITGVLIMKHYQQRRRAIRPEGDPAAYWRNPHGRPPDAKELAAYRELELEGRRVVRDVLGGEFNFDDDGSAQRRQFGGLSDEKVAKLKKIFADYTDLEEQLYADGSDRGSSEMRARSALLAKEKRADIERLLTPDELLDYDLRNSPASHRLRGKLAAFEPTEAEFRALYPAFKAVADAEPQPGAAPRGTDFRRAREAAERELEVELRRVLGEARFAQWQEANDRGLQETRALATSLSLPPTAVAEITAIQKEIQPKLASIERDRDLTPNQRDAQLAALGADARDRLTRVLGDKGFEAYKRKGGGWLGAALNRIVPPPP